MYGEALGGGVGGVMKESIRGEKQIGFAKPATAADVTAANRRMIGGVHELTRNAVRVLR